VVDQRIGERHAAGPGTDHEVVGLDFPRHGATKAQAMRLRTPAAWSNRAGPVNLKSLVLPKNRQLPRTLATYSTPNFPWGDP